MSDSITLNDSNHNIRAGFWARFAAIWIDTLFIFIITFVIIIFGRIFSTYIPFELTFIIMAIFYSIVFLGWKGHTFGKKICGLHLQKKNGLSISYLTLFIREFIGKFIIAIIIPSGIAYSILNHSEKEKFIPMLALIFVIFALIIFLIQYFITRRTWYDYISRTIVVQNITLRNRARWIIGFIIMASAILIARKGIEFRSIFNIVNEMSGYATAKTVYDSRDSSLIEISSFNPIQDSELVRWLDQNGKSPIDYTIEKALQHQILIIGEHHFVQKQVQFLHELIPALYHHAGVRCLALEVCTHEDNNVINQLITAEKYDQELASHIGRNQPWHSWGGKEYWDIFAVVWRLNNSLSEGQPKMRIIGIDSQWDGVSFSLVIPGDDFTEGAAWEKLRIIRAILTLPNFISRDELMAKEVEKEIIEKGERGIVWIGSNHSFIRYKQPFQRKGRMAFILHQKYGDKIFQITLHSRDSSPTNCDPDYKGPEPEMGNFIERIMAARGHQQVGFDVTGSPFMFLRDSTNYYYHCQPKVCFGDVTSGYIYLEPKALFKNCQWVEGFITSPMFAKYKPFYEGRAGRKLKNAQEVNEYFTKELIKQ